MLKSLITYPYYHTRIDPKYYPKDQYIQTIEDNYNKNKHRNSWNTGCDLHHEYNDDSLPTLDYTPLYPLYTHAIKQFLISIGADLQWSLSIENYTVSSNSQSMLPHHHVPALFSTVHYLKYNPKVHTSTLFHNPSPLEPVIDIFYPDIKDKLPKNYLSNWLYTTIELPDIQEDDIIIFPSILFHSIASSLSDETRITVVSNISLE